MNTSIQLQLDLDYINTYVKYILEESNRGPIYCGAYITTNKELHLFSYYKSNFNISNLYKRDNIDSIRGFEGILTRFKLKEINYIEFENCIYNAVKELTTSYKNLNIHPDIDFLKKEFDSHINIAYSVWKLKEIIRNLCFDYIGTAELLDFSEEDISSSLSEGEWKYYILGRKLHINFELIDYDEDNILESKIKLSNLEIC
ncbi:hypothetical protein [Clostridioides sp. ES-S-0048-02]|uniref:hypothetical protein n=1 Tax=Clostridioides sp. ES-S-0048-02 TaxID=2770777 RepID=UPI001D10D27A|nr:hypothetical protein [Clostridioides sp. ES-S-0048-02]